MKPNDRVQNVVRQFILAKDNKFPFLIGEFKKWL